LPLGFLMVPAQSERKADSIAWTTKTERFVKHTVATGDTIEKIARIYGTTIQKITSKNRLSRREKLEAGKKLIIPVDIYRKKILI